MFKLLTITLTVLSALALPAAASAQDAACPDDYVTVMSNGGPLCVAPMYLDGTWNDHPSECSHGYYQGSCAPPPPPEPVVLPVEAYTYQMDDPTPVVAEVEVKRAVWLSAVELQLADLRSAR